MRIYKIHGEEIIQHFKKVEMIVTSTSPFTMYRGNLDIEDLGQGEYRVSTDNDISNFKFTSSDEFGLDFNITKIVVKNLSGITSLNNSFTNLWELTEFICPFELTSDITDFEHAWSFCNSLTLFPSIDVSSGTNFRYTWYNCSALPHCPGGNEVTIPAGATTTNMCSGI